MRLGKYQLLRKLATGGMAEVFLAKTDGPMGFEKLLVIKRILPHLAEDPQFVEMFLGEAKLAAQLNHPNLVQIFDFGRAEGSYFIAMEYIDGENLRSLLVRARDLNRSVPFPIAARIVSFAAEGLAYAHDFTDLGTGQPLHLIHRDVSPDNILVGRSGAVKLVDFGIAKATGQSHQTQAGTVKGKVAYMAPEQLRGEPLDRRVDLYSLGIVLYELCTGRMPFEAESDASMVRAVLYDRPVPAVERVPSIPRSLQEILARLLARRREDRYADCHTLHLDLERFLRQTSGDSTTAFVISRWVSQLAPPGPPTAAPTPSGIRPEPASFTGSAFAPTGPILLDQPVTESFAVAPVPMELDRTVRRPTREQQQASPGFVFPTALGEERSIVEPVPLGIKRTNSRQDVIRTDVRPPPRRSGGSSLLLRMFLIALLAIVGAGLGLWAAGRTDLLAAVGLPVPGVKPSPAVAAPTTGVADTSRNPATVTPPAPVPVAPTSTPAAPPVVATPTPPAATPPTAPGPSSSNPPPPPVSAPPTRSPAANTPPPATTRPAPPAVAAAVPPATRTPASKPSSPAESDDPAPKERKASDREKLLGAFAEAQAAAEAPATVRVESTPKLRVRLGDKVLGSTPLTVSLPPPGGSAEIELFDPGLNISKTVTLDLKQGDNGVQKIVIPRGTLELKVDDGAAVTIDGKTAGTAPLDPVQLYEGRHQVQLSKGDLKERRLVEITGGQTEVLEFSFPEER